MEWSGLIWMDIEGSVEKPEDLVIKIIDFTLFDIGSGAYTEFAVDPEIIMDVFEKHPEYISKKYGCLHSHNNMSVFFSGTDTSTLLEQAFIHNFFVSLIINNKFDKIAKISYKGKLKREIKETFFNRVGAIFLPFNRTIQEEADVVYVIDCDVSYERITPDDDELLSQITVLQAKEAERKSKLQNVRYDGFGYQESRIGFNWPDRQQHGHSTVSNKNGKKFKKNKGKYNGISDFPTLFDAKEDKFHKSVDSFEEKCENFVKRTLCIDYLGDIDIMSMDQAREEFEEEYGDVNINDYLKEVRDFVDGELELYFRKEIEANWYEVGKFNRLKAMLASNFTKLLNPLTHEKDVLEILDYKLKTLENEREKEFTN